jgi:hypothetical protein
MLVHETSTSPSSGGAAGRAPVRAKDGPVDFPEGVLAVSAPAAPLLLFFGVETGEAEEEELEEGEAEGKEADEDDAADAPAAAGPPPPADTLTGAMLSPPDVGEAQCLTER